MIQIFSSAKRFLAFMDKPFNANSAWLYDLLPARLGYATGDIWDDALQRFGMAWRGTGKEQMTLAYPEELELAAPATARSAPPFAGGFADPQARYTFTQIADACASTTTALNEQWWPAVWSGQINSDTITPLKQGYERQYAVADSATALSSRRRLRRSPQSWQGNWSLQARAVPTPPD